MDHRQKYSWLLYEYNVSMKTSREHFGGSGCSTHPEYMCVSLGMNLTSKAYKCLLRMLALNRATSNQKKLGELFCLVLSSQDFAPSRPSNLCGRDLHELARITFSLAPHSKWVKGKETLSDMDCCDVLWRIEYVLQTLVRFSRTRLQ